MGTPPFSGSQPGPMAGAGDLMAAGNPAAGQDAARAALQQTAMQIREINTLVQQTMASNPLIAGDLQQIEAILKNALIKAAQTAPTQTASSMAVPGGGGV